MKSKYLYPAWAVLYIVCVCFGAIPDRNTAGHVLLTLFSLAFFIPPAILLVRALKTQDSKTLRRLRLLSILSLTLTMLALVGNIASVLAGQLVGDIAYVVLLLVSAPMLCCKYWIAPMLLWAILLFSTFPKIWNTK